MYVSAPTLDRSKVIGAGSRARDAIASGITSQQSEYFDLKDAHEVHSWLRATSAAFGRTIIGPGMTIGPVAGKANEADTNERDFLHDFYYGISGRDFNNISDWYPFSAKMYRTAGQFHLFGQAAWELRKNGFGEVVSYDVIPGFVWPNCDENGDFQDPPFIQYLTPQKGIDLKVDPSSIVMFMNPDFGTRHFATDFESLSEYTLPTDIYLTKAMRSLLENHRTPFGFFSLDEHSTQEEVQDFSVKLDSLYRGAENYGKAAVVVRGDAEFNSVTPALKDLPFRDGHNAMKDEIEGVSGVSGSKLGRTDEISRSNLREIRRDYWESTHLPVVTLLAEQMYVLIHQRIFNISDWYPVFRAPDFLTQVEKATVGMRGRQWGAMNTNEFRSYVFDMQPVPEEWADTDYLWPKNMEIAGSSTPADGETPVAEPSTGSDVPVRGDTNNTEEGRRAAVNEMRAFARFSLNRVGKSDAREFEFHYVPDNVISLTREALDEYGNSRDNVKMVFDAVIRGMSNG